MIMLITAPLTFPAWLAIAIAGKIVAKNGDPLADLASLAVAIKTR